jgi:tetratricopeptide (TPR) repeat protein
VPLVQLLAVFALAFLLHTLLAHVPGLGFLARIPLIGFLGCVLLVSYAWTRLAGRVTRARVLRRTFESFGRVDTPAMQGKLGAALLAAGRAKDALLPLATARAGEPKELEWAWRNANALAAVRRDEEALREVQWLLERDAEYGYGRARLLSARLFARLGQRDDAIAACKRFEADHGEEPEALYELGAVLAASGERGAARDAFRRAAHAAARAATFKRRVSPWLGPKARLRALIGR